MSYLSGLALELSVTCIIIIIVKDSSYVIVIDRGLVLVTGEVIVKYNNSIGDEPK